jgi:large subunit ribosomal protein L18
MIDDEKGHTLISGFSKTGEKTGEILSEKAIKSGIKTAVFDRGHYKYHGHVKMLAEAMRKKGVKI